MNAQPFEGKRLLVTGGTGSLGKVLVRRLLSGEMGMPAKVIVFSRDEAKQHFMRVEWQQRAAATDEIIYRDFEGRLESRIGDVRDFGRLSSVLRNVDIVFNAAALKQVPACEYAPYEAVQTNIIGPENIVRAIQEHDLPIDTVVGISTDKACKPVNVMGMTKAIQERVFIQASMRCPHTHFLCVRYGNVLASRGSVIPLFHEQIRSGGPVTVTAPDMTRFLLSLGGAVDTIFAAIRDGRPGETYVPRVSSALVMDIARALVGDRQVGIEMIGIRPGEKLHEILVSEEEAHHTIEREGWYVILPMLPELRPESCAERCLRKEYSSADDLMSLEQTVELLVRHRLMVGDAPVEAGEMLR